MNLRICESISHLILHEHGDDDDAKVFIGKTWCDVFFISKKVMCLTLIWKRLLVL